MRQRILPSKFWVSTTWQDALVAVEGLYSCATMHHRLEMSGKYFALKNVAR